MTDDLSSRFGPLDDPGEPRRDRPPTRPVPPAPRPTAPHALSPSRQTWYAAPLWRRSLATLIDLVPTLGLATVAAWVLIASDPEPPSIPPWNLLDQVVDYLQNRPGRATLIALVLVLVQVLWPIVFRTQTPGRRALGVGLVDAQGLTPTRARTLTWALARIPSVLFGGVGVWWSLVDPERRTLHDRAAKLWLVQRSRAGRPDA
jgi:uncharacterized RDD family membrane protein YckC